MQAACPKEGCGASYNLSAQYVGRSFQCKRCQSELRVENDGLHFVQQEPEPAGFAGPVTTDYANPGTSVRRTTRSSAGLMEMIPPSFFNYLFIAGSMLVVLFVFLPLVDRADIVRAEAHVKTGDQEQSRLDRQLTESETPPTADQRKQRTEERKTWTTKKLKLEDTVADVEADANTSLYWYTWGMLFGFLVLAVGSIGFLNDGTKIKRVVGSIVICAMLLLVFFTFVGRSSLAGL